MTEPQFIAFYGTLMQEQHLAIREHLKDKLTSCGPCLIPGNIYNLGRYPDLKLDGARRSVHGELYEITDPEPLALLDAPQQLAWVYEYDGPVKPEQLIQSENWYKLSN